MKIKQMKLIKGDRKHSVTIPNGYIQDLGWNPRSLVNVSLEEYEGLPTGKIIINSTEEPNLKLDSKNYLSKLDTRRKYLTRNSIERGEKIYAREVERVKEKAWFKNSTNAQNFISDFDNNISYYNQNNLELVNFNTNKFKVTNRTLRSKLSSQVFIKSSETKSIKSRARIKKPKKARI